MHILLFHDSKLPPKHYGGIERIVVMLAAEYLKNGHKVSVLCQKGSQLPGCQMIELPEKFFGNIEDLIPNDIDFIHAHQPLHVEPKRPYLVTIHGNGHPGEKYLPNTNFLSRSHTRNHNGSVFVFNGIDTEIYKLNEHKEDYYVFLARASWRVKNLKTTIAWANDMKVPLKIMGGHGISRGYIEYLGNADDKMKNEVLGKAKALVYLTNWDEPCAVAPLESLACGTPVIATRNGCMPEMVEHGLTGVLVDTYQELLKAPEVLKTVSPWECRKKAETVFSRERMAKDYLALMERIITQGKLVGPDHLPCYNFKKESVRLMYKPTLWNRLRVELTGKV